MNFGFTPEQNLLREQARRFLDDRAPMAAVRAAAASAAGYDTDLWREIAALGWTGLVVPEAHGGSGLGWVDLTVILEETGRSLLPSPLLGHVLAEVAIAEHGSESQQARWLPRLADGSCIGSVALLDDADWPEAAAITLAARTDGDDLLLEGARGFVDHAGNADLIVAAVRTGTGPEALSLVVIERGDPGVSTTLEAPMDTTKRTGSLRLDQVRLPAQRILGRRDAAWPWIRRLLDQGAVAVTAEAVGAVDRALEITSNYARERIQFGKPIGQYQGVKHRLAEIYVDVESVRSLAYYAAWAVDEDPDDLTRASSLAKAYASESFPRIGIDAVGLHGAIGFTAEYDIQLYLKRTKWMRPAFGDADYHYDRVAGI